MLIGQHVRLRGAERDDLPTFVHWLNDPEVRQYLLLYAPLSLADEELWFENIPQLPGATRSQYLFVIEVLAGTHGTPIGTTGLMSIDWKNRACGFGISIGDKRYWGQGYGTEATRLVLRFAFDELNLHRVGLEVFDFNPRATRTYEKVGFKLEGTQRQAFYRDGQYHDVHIMSILHDEFQYDAS